MRESTNKVTAGLANLKDTRTGKRILEFGSGLTRCRNSTGLYLGPKTKIFFPLRAMPLNTRANATNVSWLVSWLLSSRGAGLGVTLPPCGSPSARNKGVMSAKHALPRAGDTEGQ